MQQPEAAISRFLLTNAPPTAHEAEFLRDQVNAIEREIESMGHQARNMEGASDKSTRLKAVEIRSEIPDLKSRLRQYKVTLSPCRRMPLEILGEMIIYTIGQAIPARRAETLGRICLVCRNWRDAAHLVPKLWNEVLASVSVPGFSSDALSVWLSRSRNSPRSLSLSCFSPCTECRRGGPCYFSNPEIAKLLKTGPSLDSLTIKCTAPECFRNFADAFHIFGGDGTDSNWSSLRSLTIDAKLWTRWISIPTSSFEFIPPSVSSLSLDLTDVDDMGLADISILYINIPLDVLCHLIHLNLVCNWTIDNVMKILRHCTTLETFRAQLSSVSGAWSDSRFMQNLIASGVVFPRLQSLVLDSVRADLLEDLRCVQLPSLLQSSISIGKENPWCPRYGSRRNDNLIQDGMGSHFAAFLRGNTTSPSTLQTLKISNASFVGNSLFEVLRGLTSLTKLTLKSVQLDGDLFVKLREAKSLPELGVMNLLLLHTRSRDHLAGLWRFVEERGVKLTTSWCQHCS